MTERRRRLDDNLVSVGETVACVHCAYPVGSVDDWLSHAIVREQSAQDGGSLVPADPALYVDATVVFRQAFCPGCLTALLTEVVAQSDRTYRTKKIRSRHVG